MAHITEMWSYGPFRRPLHIIDDSTLVEGQELGFQEGFEFGLEAVRVLGHTREVDTFGSPLLDQAANRELFEEQVEIVFKAFNNAAFSHQGTHYTLPPRVPYRGYELTELTLVPRPVRPVECWQPIQSATARGIDFMARHGIKGVIGGGVADGGALRAGDRGLPRRLARGPDARPRWATDSSIGFHFHLAETQEPRSRGRRRLL